MLIREPLLVIFLKMIDRIPMPVASTKRKRGHPKEYSDRLILKALMVMIIRRLYSAYGLLEFLEQETDLTQALRKQLSAFRPIFDAPWPRFGRASNCLFKEIS